MKNIFFTDESVKRQITDSISENLTYSDLESKYTVFVKIKNSIFLKKYTRCGKNVKKQNFLFQKIYNSSVEHFSIGVISFVY